jgi:hypothetical protein
MWLMTSASTIALAEVVQTLAEARNEGRLFQRLTLHLIDAGHLVRDRIATDAEKMARLKTVFVWAANRPRLRP